MHADREMYAEILKVREKQKGCLYFNTHTTERLSSFFMKPPTHPSELKSTSSTFLLPFLSYEIFEHKLTLL